MDPNKMKEVWNCRAAHAFAANLANLGRKGKAVPPATVRVPPRGSGRSERAPAATAGIPALDIVSAHGRVFFQRPVYGCIKTQNQRIIQYESNEKSMSSGSGLNKELRTFTLDPPKLKTRSKRDRGLRTLWCGNSDSQLAEEVLWALKGRTCTGR